MLDVLPRMLLGATLGLALVLLLRVPARRLFGAGPAFTLWLLPVVLMLAPGLPQRFAPAALVTLPGIAITPRMTAVYTHGEFDWTLLLVALWVAGAVFGFARLAWRYVRLRAAARRGSMAWVAAVAVSAPNVDTRRIRVHADGPAVLWAWPRALLLLPADFAQRFGNAATRELVLRHELTHVRRGDAWWSAGMEVMSALLWLHPLAWVARSRFWLDLELACDAASLRDAPQHTARYARALLDSVAARPVPVLIPWLAEPQLKERIAMLAHKIPGTARRRAGFLAVAALLGGGLLAMGSRAAVPAGLRQSVAPAVDINFKNSNPPRYPVDAVHNGEQGLVMLRVRVDAAGNVTNVAIDAAKTTTSSAELRAAAVTAAEGWKFHPGKRDAKSVGGWVTIPVTFALAPLAACPGDQVHASKAPFQCEPLSSARASP